MADPPAQRSSANFIDHPSEIRNRIYNHFLIDEDTYTEGRDSKLIRDDIGGILIQELYPGFYKGSRRRSYLTTDWDPLHHNERKTTYTLDSKLHLQLFYNRFYMDIMDTSVAFLEDRSVHIRDLIKVISIPVPYEGPTFQRACADLAARPELKANLKQFDIRMWDYHGEEDYNAIVFAESFNRLRTSRDEDDNDNDDQDDGSD
ncbi:MAG: hypothetical protein ASARMPREDX12_006330 [Alectoria sarmentosa]|nr:MAG: hypothetical protein ASARMPREDX12_006330 [Alectoria sarmentosa]